MLYHNLIVFLLRHEGYCTLPVPLNGIARAEGFSQRETDERSCTGVGVDTWVFKELDEFGFLWFK